jgi:hypothetical protein
MFMKLLVYVPLLTPRIKYIFHFIFHDVLKTEIGFSVNIREFVQSSLPKFCYASQPISGELFFKSTGLLLSHKITEQDISTTVFGDMKVPFSVQKSALPFDVFAASFYFLSRYEEYLSPKNQPYSPESSLQYQLDLLKLPVIDDWALLLKNILSSQFPSLRFGSSEFSFNPLQAAYPPAKDQHQGLIAKTMGYLKTLAFKGSAKHTEMLATIQQVIQSATSPENAGATIPSPDGKNHFATALQMPKTYVKQTKNNTPNDYSMFYPQQPGFRAGTCSPFPWYDLQLDKSTQLLVHPVATTDLALMHNKNPEALLLQFNELLAQVKLVNGHFYFLALSHDIRPQ